jgi:myosin heavy subunit
MRIANPIYDVVFKYLMEDIDIAKDFLGAILNVEILSLEIKPQELPINILGGISVMRIDFKAKIRLINGNIQLVLIEIQKSKRHFNILRFRRYLSKNYKDTEQIVGVNGEIEEVSLPITSIYFLGYKLDNVDVPVLKVAREYQDAITGAKIMLKEDFVEKLSHDMYAIQIPRLKMEVKTELEKMLDVFSQGKYKTDESHVLEYTGDTKNPKIARMLKRLNGIFLDEEVLRAIEAEEEIEDEMELMNREIERNRSELEKKQGELEKTSSELEKTSSELEKTSSELEKTSSELEKTSSELEKIRKAEEKTAKENEELKKQIEILLRERK